MSCGDIGHTLEKGKPFGVVVCGPCACGKSEVASALANHFQVPFVDADSFHSDSNIKKMSSGIPLTDEDRLPWLLTVRQEMIDKTNLPEAVKSFVSVVAACSALTRRYRNILRGAEKNDGDLLPVVFVFLNCSQEVLQKRLNERQGHFMKANMLSSQLATLEIPQEMELAHAVVVNGDAPLISVLEEAIKKLGMISQI